MKLGRFGVALCLSGLLGGCVGSPLESDAGVVADAGAPDAGVVDAGTTDAGTTDAGTTDAGTTDAGTTDAGTTDAGTTDAGTTDAGNTDAGTTDAGTTDSGFSDAGVLDAGSLDAGWLVETVDMSSSQWPSIAVTAQGVAFISYSSSGLKMAQRQGGTWTTQPVDSSALVGFPNSIALSAAGDPRIAYSDQSNLTTKYAERNNGVWHLEVASSSEPELSVTLVLDSLGRPSIGYDTFTEESYWVTRAATTWSTPRLLGPSSSYGTVQVDSSDVQHFAYVVIDTDPRTVRYLARPYQLGDSSEPISPIPDTRPGPPAFVLDPSGVAHIIITEDVIRYARRTNGVWSLEQVDTPTMVSFPRASLAVDAQGSVHTCYFDDASKKVRYAKRGPNGWTIEPLPIGGSEDLALAVDLGGAVHIAVIDGSKLVYLRR
jgi:hypothetical protein